MLEAYGRAEAFLRIQPAMLMEDLGNRHLIGPIAVAGRKRRDELAARLRLHPGERCVLVAMGGMEYRLPLEDWPTQPAIRWLVPAAWGVKRADVVAFDGLGMSFSDLLASCDAVLTKPGYGTFAEAARAGVPVLYAARRDWPETVGLTEWLSQHVPCCEVEPARLRQGRLAELLEAVWGRSVQPWAGADGVGQAVAYLSGALRETY